MTMTPKQTQLWHSECAILKRILWGRCSEPFISGTLPTSIRKPLYDFVCQSINDNSGDGSIFMEAFVAYATQLDLQSLTATQYTHAIKQFHEIPIIKTSLEQLQENIDFQAKRLSLLDKESVSVLERLFDESSASADSPDSDGEEFLCGELSSSLATEEKSISGGDSGCASQLLKESLRIDFSLEAVVVSINTWVYERFSPIDERVQSNDERKLRRMDSLARLLSLRNTTSVCTAVTFCFSDEPRIIIGANVGRNGDQETIFRDTAAKLAIIKRQLKEIAGRDISSIDAIELDRLANGLVKELFTAGSTSTPLDVLQQAARKLIDAICIDAETFNAAEKMLFLRQSSAVMLLPSLSEFTYAMQARQINSSGHINSRYPLAMVPKGTSISNIHAEQLIVRFLYEELRLDTQHILGINKLCCRTCFRSLSQYPVVTRGHHNQTYEGVIDLQSGQCSTESSKRHAPTHAHSSPGDTPDKRKSHLEPSSKAAVSLRPRLASSLLQHSLFGSPGEEMSDVVPRKEPTFP